MTNVLNGQVINRTHQCSPIINDALVQHSTQHLRKLSVFERLLNQALQRRFETKVGRKEVQYIFKRRSEIVRKAHALGEAENMDILFPQVRRDLIHVILSASSLN